LNGADHGDCVGLSYDGNTLASCRGTGNGIDIFTRTGSSVWSFQSRLESGSGSDAFGQNVALSADGNTLATAVWSAKKVYVFVRSGTMWSRQAVLSNAGRSSARSPLSLSGDGRTLAVSASGETAVFFNDGVFWYQQSTIVGTDSDGSRASGSLRSVALSRDGHILALGVTGSYPHFSDGVVWIFTLSNDVWVQQDWLSPKTTTNTFGESVSLSASGTILAVGSPQDNDFQGLTWIFESPSGMSLNTTSPLQQQGCKLVGAGGIGYSRRGNLAISRDASSLAVGAPSDNHGMGAVWIFSREEGFLVQQGEKLVGKGSFVALSYDGNILALHNPGGGGTIWIFRRASNGTWSQEADPLVGMGEGKSLALSHDGTTLCVGTTNLQVWIFTREEGIFTQQGEQQLVGKGSYVSLSYEGDTLAVGNPQDSDSHGAVSIFIRASNGTWSQQGDKLVGSGSVGYQPQQGGSVSLSDDGDVVAFGGRYDSNGQGAVWIFGQSLGVWSQQGDKLVGIGSVGRSYQGCSVSLSSDGATLAIGGFRDKNFAGAAWLFARSAGNSWSQVGGKMVGSGSIGKSQQGYNVALAGDGNVLASSGPGDGSGLGATWIFSSSQVQPLFRQEGEKLVGAGGNGTSSWQGRALCISKDGSTLAFGGQSDDAGNGAVWIFIRQEDVWMQQGEKLQGTGNIGRAGQGGAVSLSDDGNTLGFGGYQDNSGHGALWIFTRSSVNGTWSQQAKLVGTGSVGSPIFQGTSVSLSGDGDLAAVGGAGDSNQKGAVWIFTRSMGIWTQQGPKLVGSGSIPGGIFERSVFQGYSVSLSSDGNTLCTGGYDDNDQGAVWIFVRTNVTWAQQGPKLVGTGSVGENIYQGFSVSLSNDGNTVAVGGRRDGRFNGLNNDHHGAVWIFTRTDGAWSQQGPKLVGRDGNGPVIYQGTSVSLSGDGNVLAVGGPGDGGTGAVWVFVRTEEEGSWCQHGDKLIGLGVTREELQNSQQGHSVSLSGNGDVLVSGGFADDGGQGAVWIFLAVEEPTSICPLNSNVNGDYSIDLIDLIAILDHWGPCVGCPSDVNCDGRVDLIDLVYVLNDWS